MSIFMQTRSGKAIDFDAIEPDKIEIEDIAIGLSRINRYLGHTVDPLTVAEHSVRVSLLVSDWYPDDHSLQLRALLHDASEAIVGDVTAPVKRWIRQQSYVLDVLEARIERAILTRFGLRHMLSDPPMPLAECEAIAEIIKRADLTLLATEHRDLVPPGERDWNLTHEPLPKKHARPASPEVAERVFLERFEALQDLRAKEAE